MKRRWFQGFSSICCALFLAAAFLSCSSGGGGDDEEENGGSSGNGRVKLTIIAPDKAYGSIEVKPISVDNTYDKGTTVELKVYENYESSYDFKSWTNNATENPLKITLNEDFTIGARFANWNGEFAPGTEVAVNVSTLPAGIGTPTVSPAAGPYKAGDSVTFSAPAIEGYTFVNWTVNNEYVPASLESSFTTVLKKDVSMVANYSKNEWTVMVYMDGDNDLEQFAIADLNEMENVNLSGSGINVIALLDRGAVTGSDDTTNGNWTGTRLIPVKYDYQLNKTILSAPIASTTLGLTANGTEELNMADPTTLSNFVTACQQIAKADNYMLILWDHGTGWRSAGFSANGSVIGTGDGLTMLGGSSYSPIVERSAGNGEYRSVCFDSTSNDILYNAEVAGAIKGKGITVVGFDLCLAGMIEVAYELKDCASYMIASPEVTPSDGWEYQDWLKSFKELTPPRTGINLVNTVVSEYYYGTTTGACIAGYDLSKAGALATAFNAAMGEAETYIRAGTTAADRLSRAKAVYDAIYYAESYYNVPGDLNVDIGDLMTSLGTYATAAVSSASRTAVKDAVTSLVCNKWYNSNTYPASSSNANGTGVAVHVVTLNSSGKPSLGDDDPAYCVDHATSFTPAPVSVPAFVDYATNWCSNISGKKGVIWLLFGESDLYK